MVGAGRLGGIFSQLSDIPQTWLRAEVLGAAAQGPAIVSGGLHLAPAWARLQSPWDGHPQGSSEPISFPP